MQSPATYNVVDYLLLEAANGQSLTVVVNKRIKDGYQLFGVTFGSHSGGYAQAVVKLERAARQPVLGNMAID